MSTQSYLGKMPDIILSRYGAEGFGYYTWTDRAIVQFEIRTSGASGRGEDWTGHDGG